MGSGFEGFVLFGFLSVMMLIGVVVRAKVKLFQDFLVPSSIIAGFLGFGVVALGNYFGTPGPDGKIVSALSLGGISITHSQFNQFVFHAFNLSFMSLLLTPTSGKKDALPKHILQGGLWQTFLWTISLTGQALVGGLIIWIYNILSGGQVSEFLGYIVTHGYTQGPGQAFVMGRLWETNGGIADATNVGLIYAAMGFFSAVVVGVPLARWLVRKGLNANKRAKLDEEFLTGLMKPESNVPNGRETTHASNIDTLAFHLVLIGITYLITYLELSWLQANVKPFFDSTQWLKGFGALCSLPMFFIHGLIVGYLVRKVMEMLGIVRLIDPVVQTRITGASVDFLVVATLVAVEFKVLSAYALPIFLVCIGATLFTLFIVLFFGRRTEHLGPERLSAQFGCCCGSTASGLLLLRILDPDFSTTVAVELGFFNVAILISTGPILWFIAPVLYSLSTLHIVLIYAAYTVVFAALMFGMKLVRREKVW